MGLGRAICIDEEDRTGCPAPWWLPGQEDGFEPWAAATGEVGSEARRLPWLPWAAPMTVTGSHPGGMCGELVPLVIARTPRGCPLHPGLRRGAQSRGRPPQAGGILLAGPCASSPLPGSLWYPPSPPLIPPSLSPAFALVASTHLLLLSLCLSSFLLSFLCLSSCVTLLFFPCTPHPQPCLQLPSPPQGLGSSKPRVTSTHGEQGRGCPWRSGWGCACLDCPGI